MAPIPPPFQVPFTIVALYPELLQLDAAAQAAVHSHIESAAALTDFRQTIQRQGPPAKSSGWARLEPIVLSDGEPAKNAKGEVIDRLQLSDDTVKALPLLLAQVLTAALQDPALEGLCWTVQAGVAPREESGTPATGGWTLTTLAPRAGLLAPRVQFEASDRSFSLDLDNDVPRHLGIYARFLADGVPIEPQGWQSRLPATASDLESATVKYLATVLPSTSVAGIAVVSDPQPVQVTLPGQATALEIVAGGVGAAAWSSLESAAGAMSTFILDYAVPAIALQAGDGASELGSWYQALLADDSVADEVLAAAVGIVEDASIKDASSALRFLTTEVASLLLGDELASLRERLDKKLGEGAVAAAAPQLGWPAQTLGALVDAEPSVAADATSRLLSTPATFRIPLAPDTVVDLALAVEAGAATGEWPDGAEAYSARIEYASGFTQQQSGSLPLTPGGALPLTFGSVRLSGPIRAEATLSTAEGEIRATGEQTISPPSVPISSPLHAAVGLQYEPVVLSASSRFVPRRTLAYDKDGEAYEWVPTSTPPTKTEADLAACDPGRRELCELVGLTLQSSMRSVGYAWRASGQGVSQCGGSGSPLGVAYLFQNVGTIDASQPLKALDCGFLGQATLAYGQLAANANFYLDPRGTSPCLRPVDLAHAGPFDITTDTCRGRFQETVLRAVAVHPDGFAAAVSQVNDRLEIVELAPGDVADDQAPRSTVYGGPGSREGLLGAPVGLAASPDGFLLVLESGNSRIQAFDPHGNPVPLFSGSPFLALKGGSETAYLDLAISPNGWIYVLSTIQGGAQASDYLLDVYEPGGSFLARTVGVPAARIAVDALERVYALDYATIVGPNLRTEPSLTVWGPEAG